MGTFDKKNKGRDTAARSDSRKEASAASKPKATVHFVTLSKEERAALRIDAYPYLI